MVSSFCVLAVLAGEQVLAPIPEKNVWQAIQWIVEMKDGQRGPYQGVAWFCSDGAVLPPKSYACRERGGGLQYGVLGKPARRLGDLGIHVGTVLASLEPEDLQADDLYRARALVVERYLERALDGWVLREATDYRGFRQTEDEQAAARRLLMVLVQKPGVYERKRNLAVRLVRALPYGRNSSLADEIRALAGVIGDEDPAFDRLRFKIHAMPEPADITAVDAYAAQARPGRLADRARQLSAKMRRHYDPLARRQRLNAVRRWVRDAPLIEAINQFVATPPQDVMRMVTAGLGVMEAAEATLAPARGARVQGERNLLALHVMALVEELWIGITADLARATLSRRETLTLLDALVQAARHLGVLSLREEASAAAALARMDSGRITDYVGGLQEARRLLEWGRARQLADLGLPLERYGQIEPRAWGVVDDILRSGVMLPLASVLDRLTADAEGHLAGNQLLGAPPGTTVALRGETPGIAAGPLRVLSPGDDPGVLARHEVALLNELPPQLPPVAGVIAVGGVGSLSHVSLLARNLGIPVVAVDEAVAQWLRGIAGREIVLGVSTHRRVLLADRAALGPERSRLLVSRRHADRPSLSVDVDRLDLERHAILRLDDVSERDSGRRVGPKAAELGRLRRLFPERVSDAVVIPFGGFVRHVDRPSADGGPSPLARLARVYRLARRLAPHRAEPLLLAELSRFREAIAVLPFDDGFAAEIDAGLADLGEPGTFGVFVRSDTNVEDLEEFTGAGLNRTVPHRVERDDILAGIRKVWMSPFTERSYRWRQRVLENPEHVYPSVILHRTVPVETSGVLVTCDIERGDEQALTVSVSEGVAAVVDGGAPETLVIERDGAIRLLASSRTAKRKLIPPLPQQGIELRAAKGSDPLLDTSALEEIRGMANQVKAVIPAKAGLPWDIEFGLYQGRAYLFQIRPLRAARSPATHPLLTSLDAAATARPRLDLDAPLP